MNTLLAMHVDSVSVATLKQPQPLIVLLYNTTHHVILLYKEHTVYQSHQTQCSYHGEIYFKYWLTTT